jgi:hypothetical protein
MKMKAIHRFNTVLKRLVAGIAMSASVSLTAQALTQDITAIFQPDSANPQMNRFKNTTPQSGVCEYHAPAKPRCDALNIFTIRTTAFSIPQSGPILANEADPRRRAMFKVPSDWRSLPVINQVTGETETVEVRIAGIGVFWHVPYPPGVSAWAVPGFNWADRWYQGVGACQGVNYIAAGTRQAMFFWAVPEGAGACSLEPGMHLDWMQYSHLEYAYELRTPNPLTMSSGQYTGAMGYTMGPGQDFDFGDVMIPGDDQFIFNFTLTVEHTLKVEVPPGGNQIDLVPQGGWQAWLNQGRKPARLFRDQTFNISSSSRFKMNMDCQYPIGDTCGLQDEAGNEVPLQVLVTLPNGLTREDDSPVNRQPLLKSGIGTALFKPGYYVDRKPGALHFEIERDDVAQMLDRTAATYKGDVTVIWDSEV